MRKIDHVRKTVYIIVGCLTIVSLVLTICHKVGHCAENFFPVYNDSTIYPSEELPNMTYEDFLEEADRVTNNINNCLIYYFYDNSVLYVGLLEFDNGANSVYVSDRNDSVNNVPTYLIDTSTANSVISSGSDVYMFIANNYSVTYHVWRSSNGSLVYNTSGRYSSFRTNNYNRFYFYVGKNIYNHLDGGLLFCNEVPNSGGNLGHTKGGVLTNYEDSYDLIEQDSSLPSVDTTPPADPSSNANWFQKILNGMSKINDSIKAGVLTIGDYIGQFKAWFSEPFDQEAFSDELGEIALINDFSNLKTLVENCGIFDWSDVTPAQSVSFTFDFGGAVLPHTSCVIDFSWYTGTVKNLCVGILCTFLVIGLLVTIINQLPNIIGGKSGDKGGGSDS